MKVEDTDLKGRALLNTVVGMLTHHYEGKIFFKDKYVRYSIFG